MSWQHTMIPALPLSRRGFLDAPTPYLIGLLLNYSNVESNIKMEPPKQQSKKKNNSFGRKKHLSDSFIRSFSYSSRETKKCTDHEFDRISLRSNDDRVERPVSEPISMAASTEFMTHENEEEIQFWRAFLNGQYELESDSIVILLDKDADETRSNGAKKSCNAKFKPPSHFVKMLKAPGDDVCCMKLPHPVIGMIQQRFELFEKSLQVLPTLLDLEEIERGKFVILCETFLHMYNNIFGSLEDYLNSNVIWEMVSCENEFNSTEDHQYYVEHYFNVRHFGFSFLYQ